MSLLIHRGVLHTGTHTFYRVERNSSGNNLLKADDGNLAPRLTPASIHIKIYMTCNKKRSYTTSQIGCKWWKMCSAFNVSFNKFKNGLLHFYIALQTVMILILWDNFLDWKLNFTESLICKCSYQITGLNSSFTIIQLISDSIFVNFYLKKEMKVV
jgi:hypothetical protein